MFKRLLRPFIFPEHPNLLLLAVYFWLVVGPFFFVALSLINAMFYYYYYNPKVTALFNTARSFTGCVFIGELFRVRVISGDHLVQELISACGVVIRCFQLDDQLNCAHILFDGGVVLFKARGCVVDVIEDESEVCFASKWRFTFKGEKKGIDLIQG